MSNLRNRLASMNKKASGSSFEMKKINESFYIMKNTIKDLLENYEENLQNNPELMKTIEKVKNELEKMDSDISFIRDNL